MIIRIPVRLLLALLYTAGVLGAAFGISYAVFEWRDAEGGSTGSVTLESLDSRIDSLGGRVSSLSGASGGVSASEARAIAQDEASKASGQAMKAVLCLESFRGSGLSQGQLEAAIRGCIDQ